MGCGVRRRCGSDLALLWLWRWPAAVAPIQLLAWEPPYAVGAALKKKQKKKVAFRKCGLESAQGSFSQWQTLGGEDALPVTS